jgi:hypothetical protein
MENLFGSPVAKTPASTLALAETAAKTPRALAAAIARYSASIRSRSEFGAPSEAVMRMHEDSLDLELLERAGLAADIILSPRLDCLWVCPEVIESLTELFGMSPDARAAMAEACLDSAPALGRTPFTNLDGSATNDLPKILHEWSGHALKLFDKRAINPQGHARLQNLFKLPDGFAGARSLAEINLRIEEAVNVLGFDYPAEIEELLLRMTGLLDIDTFNLGQDGGAEIQGVAYALTIAHVAFHAGLKVGREVPRIPLQEAYGFLVECAMIGTADRVANGAARSCETTKPGPSPFMVHRPEAVHAVAAALCGIIEEKGGFAAVVAATDLLSDGEFHGLVDKEAGHIAAEIGFATRSHHSEDVMREILSDRLFGVLPPLFYGDDRKIETDPQVIDETCARLTRALRVVYPDARAIALEDRHAELVQRLSKR